ncbi:MAG TPA: hypothetical protein VH598_05695 [Verrucomicrobiae bacterium]|nr:hypothetical protein [Verrucomicrobiae bacterium]
MKLDQLSICNTSLRDARQNASILPTAFSNAGIEEFGRQYGQDSKETLIWPFRSDNLNRTTHLPSIAFNEIGAIWQR